MALSDVIEDGSTSRQGSVWTYTKTGLTYFMDGLAYVISLAFSLFYHLAPTFEQSGGMALLAILAIAGPILLLSRLFQRKLTVIGLAAIALPVMTIVSTWLFYDVLRF